MSNGASPTPGAAVSSPLPGALTFSKALDELMAGKKVRRLDWADGNIHLKVVDEKLSIFLADKQYHPLIVSIGDLIADDWVVV